jgi:hypothetical protein
MLAAGYGRKISTTKSSTALCSVRPMSASHAIQRAGTERYLTRFPHETRICELIARAPKSTNRGTERVRVLKPKRIYAPRIISDHIMVQEDFERLHNFLLETEGLPEVSDDVRDLVEEEWPELVHKLPPKVSQSG